MKEGAGVCCGPCNPSKWEANIWGWLEVRRSAMLHYTMNEHSHWACWQYGHSGGTQGWLGVNFACRIHAVTSASSSGSLGFIVWSVVGWLIVYEDGSYHYPGQYSKTICWSQIGWYLFWGGSILMARPSTSRSWHDCGKFKKKEGLIFLSNKYFKHFLQYL